MINTADSQLHEGERNLSIPTQALTLSVVRRCTVEGSSPDDTRLIALSCFETNANVPGRIGDIHQLRRIPFSHQSAFNWIDLRSYDVRIVGECRLIVHAHRQQHPFTASSNPPCQGCGYGETAIPLASMRKHNTSYREKIPQTNLCGQLVVTSILRMHYESRA
jgi:hypothetical protein